MIGLRCATMADSDRLFTWRNDPGSLVAFRSTEAVSREAHDRWMNFNVVSGYPSHLVCIAEGADGPIGVVRFDTSKRDVMTCDVSITIAPEHRGKGYGGYVLTSACKTMPEVTLRADIRIWNIASRRIFQRCGFEEVGSDHDFVCMKRGPQWQQF